jgi:hypothetical protein
MEKRLTFSMEGRDARTIFCRERGIADERATLRKTVGEAYKLNE